MDGHDERNQERQIDERQHEGADVRLCVSEHSSQPDFRLPLVDHTRLSDWQQIESIESECIYTRQIIQFGI